MKHYQPMAISKETAIQLELFKREGTLKDFEVKYMKDERFRNLHGIDIDQLVKMMYVPGSYIIVEEPTTELEAGDFAVYERAGEIGKVFFVVKSFELTPEQNAPNDFKLTTFNSLEGGAYPAQYVRHATPDEVMKHLFPKQYEKVKKIQKKEQSSLFDF